MKEETSKKKKSHLLSQQAKTITAYVLEYDLPEFFYAYRYSAWYTVGTQ